MTLDDIVSVNITTVSARTNNITPTHPLSLLFNVLHNLLSIVTLPSVYLSYETYITQLRRSLFGVIHWEPRWIASKEELKNGKDLLVVLLQRLKIHTAKQIDNETKHKHFVLIWFRKNLPNFCTIIIYLQNCIDNTTSTDSSTTLLYNPLSLTSSFMNVEGEANDLEWC